MNEGSENRNAFSPVLAAHGCEEHTTAALALANNNFLLSFENNSFLAAFGLTMEASGVSASVYDYVFSVAFYVSCACFVNENQE